MSQTIAQQLRELAATVGPNTDYVGMSVSLNQIAQQLEKPRHAVGVSVLLTDGGRLLLGKRKNNLAAGLLSTPGGRLELDETVLQCAAREFFEETGANIFTDEISVIAAKKHIRYGDHYVMFYVHADHYTGTIGNPEPEKCEGWNFTSMLDFRPEECTEPVDVLAIVATRMADMRYPCDCYSRPHHFQCNRVRKAYAQG